MQRIEQLVSNAVGLDASRGDAISVLAVPFEPPQALLTPDTEPTTSPLDLLREFQRPIIMVFALVLAFALVWRGLTFVRTALPDAAPVLPAGGYPAPVAGGAPLSGGEGVVSGASAGARIPEPMPVSQPDPTRMVRSWLGEG